jgi:hypothetical protein
MWVQQPLLYTYRLTAGCGLRSKLRHLLTGFLSLPFLPSPAIFEVTAFFVKPASQICIVPHTAETCVHSHIGCGPACQPGIAYPTSLSRSRTKCCSFIYTTVMCNCHLLGQLRLLVAEPRHVAVCFLSLCLTFRSPQQCSFDCC